jgi:transcriptional regulator with PAS, ATPase and Fis domain
MNVNWQNEYPGAITVCDQNGIILYMNEKSKKTFSSDGGEALIGKNLLDCHPEPARIKLISMLKNGNTNVYTIEKKGIKKMIYQTPWFENNEFMGFVELSVEIPFEMPHYIRK